ncbi:TPA: sigma-54-dependent Fis family transcriptional regulator [Candidatus Poribacteria bacterium]|nr:sigma-54-dependent Fis family transcriptional regulator [Candidatus Poribacteria bacterium]
MDDTRILIAEDDFDLLKRYKRFLNNKGFKAVDTASDGEEALRKIEANIYDIVLADQKMPNPPKGIPIEECGIELLRRIKNRSPDTEVIIITAYGTTKMAFEARGLYARAYLTKPVDREKQLMPLIMEISQRQREKREARRLYESSEYQIVGENRAIQNVIRDIEKVAKTNIPVLLTGEIGTGKTHIAETIHLKSNRRTKKFAERNCAAYTDELLDNELFGHEKGAFSGATALKKGLFEHADGGIIFLDEIGEASERMQSKLLRVIEKGEFERVGGNVTIKTDVRLIAATYKDLQEEVKCGRFSEPLYSRLNAINIHIPPLRERKEDIPLLAYYFLEKYKKEEGRKNIRDFGPGVFELLEQHKWPHNVRQLRDVIRRAVIFCDSAEIILPMHLPPDFRVNPEPDPDPEILDILNIQNFKEAMKAFEKLFLYVKLQENNGNVVRTSEDIGLHRSKVHKKKKEHQL